MVVSDYIWVFEGIEDGEFSVKLFTFFLRHFDVIDLFSTQYLAKGRVNTW